jgi:hypothetical protein
MYVKDEVRDVCTWSPVVSFVVGLLKTLDVVRYELPVILYSNTATPNAYPPRVPVSAPPITDQHRSEPDNSLYLEPNS